MDLVRLLTSHGGDLNATESTGATPRDLAQQCDFYECADLIDELKGTLTVRKVANVALFTDICLSVCLSVLHRDSGKAGGRYAEEKQNTM